ncbi:MAG: acyl-CoA thioesterase [Ferruginibacter sp.]
MTPVVSVQCDFKKSLRFGESVIVETIFIPCEATKIKFKYRLFNSETGDLVAVGSSVQVFLDKAGSILQLNNPPFFEQWKHQQALM